MKEMIRQQTRFGTLALVALVAAALVAAGPAQAALMMTPLRLSADAAEADAGDDVTFFVEAWNESRVDEWANATVSVHYRFDANESNDGSGPGEPGSADWQERLALESVQLDENANATFTWTIPEDADDHNIYVELKDDAGEVLATLHLRIGDAPHIMHTMSGPADGGSAGGEAGGSSGEGSSSSGSDAGTGDSTEDSGSTGSDASTGGSSSEGGTGNAGSDASNANPEDAGSTGDARNDTPAPGVVGALAALAGAVGLAAVARRR